MLFVALSNCEGLFIYIYIYLLKNKKNWDQDQILHIEVWLSVCIEADFNMGYFLSSQGWWSPPTSNSLKYLFYLASVAQTGNGPPQNERMLSIKPSIHQFIKSPAACEARLAS